MARTHVRSRFGGIRRYKLLPAWNAAGLWILPRTPRRSSPKPCFFLLGLPQDFRTNFVAVWHCIGHDRNARSLHQHSQNCRILFLFVAYATIKPHELPTPAFPKLCSRTFARILLLFVGHVPRRSPHFRGSLALHRPRLECTKSLHKHSESCVQNLSDAFSFFCWAFPKTVACQRGHCKNVMREQSQSPFAV